MFIEMMPNATEEDIAGLEQALRDRGCIAIKNQGVERICIGVGIASGLQKLVLIEEFAAWPGVEKIIPIAESYKLAARKPGQSTTKVKINEQVTIGGPDFTIIAGPCAIESRDMLFETIKHVEKESAVIARGDHEKARTSPYSFQGLGIDGLTYLKEVRDTCHIPTITEVMESADVEVVSGHASILKVGARNCQNFKLLRAVGGIRQPVMLKNGPWMTLDEYLSSAEYILAEGNPNLILCYRGTRTADPDTSRNIIDICFLNSLREKTHLPIIVDPSHGTGKWELVLSTVLNVLGSCDGIMVDVHPNPQKALCDGRQALTFKRFSELARSIKKRLNLMNQS